MAFGGVFTIDRMPCTMLFQRSSFTCLGDCAGLHDDDDDDISWGRFTFHFPSPPSTLARSRLLCGVSVSDPWSTSGIFHDGRP
jgi:hypothetical protein